MPSIADLIRRILVREDGQSLALFAAAGIAAFAAVGLAVDVGQVVGARTEMQKAADAAALAGAQSLPSSDAAVASAHEYIHKNAAWTTGHEFVVSSTEAPNDTITVVARKRVDYSFLRVIGLSGTTVTAEATTRRGLYNGGLGLMPWGFIASNDDLSTLLQNDCYLGDDSDNNPMFQRHRTCTMKFAASTNSNGDFGALQLNPGGSGAKIYEGDIKFGSKTPHFVGDRLLSETGNMQGPTRDGVNYRLSLPKLATCPGTTRNAILVDNPGGSVSIRPGCERDPRIIVIPVVDKIDNQTGSTIIGFAMMFLTGPTGNDSNGHVEIEGEFIKLVTRLPDGVYDGTLKNGASMIELMK